MNYASKQNLLDLMPLLAAKVGSSGGGFTEWESNTSYTAGQFIVYDGEIYKVTTSFTSSTTFDDTNLEEFVPKGLSSQDIQDVIEAISSSSSGGGGIVDTLWEGHCETTTTLTLSKNALDYDFVVCWLGWENPPEDVIVSNIVVPNLTDVVNIPFFQPSSGFGNNTLWVDFEGKFISNGTQFEVTKASLSTHAQNWGCGIGSLKGIKLSSGSGSSSQDFTTSEQRIGTWIDGKPLYQKTIDCGVVPSSATSDIIIYSEQGDFETVMLVEDASYSGSAGTNDYTYNPINMLYSVSGDDYIVTYVSTTNGELNINHKCANYHVGSDLVVTIRYTKTTD